jgi:hypothetical protein
MFCLLRCAGSFLAPAWRETVMTGISGRSIMAGLAALALAACNGNAPGNNSQSETAAGTTNMDSGTGMNASSTIDMANAGTTMNGATNGSNAGQ